MAKRKEKIAIAKSSISGEEYWHYLERKMVPMPDDLLRGLADELVKWAKEDSKALILSQFYLNKGVSPNTWYRWVDRFEPLREAQKTALYLIADRREVGAITGKFNAVTVMPYLSMYKKEYKDHAEWRASLNNKDKSDNETKIVIIERFPETSIVPVKIVDKE